MNFTFNNDPEPLMLKVEPAYIGWQCTWESYDFGAPIGLGRTPQDAIENYLDSHENQYDERLTNYRWK